MVRRVLPRALSSASIEPLDNGKLKAKNKIFMINNLTGSY